MKCNASSQLGRRAFLQLSGLAAAGSYLGPLANAAGPAGTTPRATHTLRIRRGEVELAPGRRITTTTYNGQLPGPPLRATVGQPLRIDVYNETDSCEQLHWQGQRLVDETAAVIPAHSWRRMEFTPNAPGRISIIRRRSPPPISERGLYSGQAGALLVEPRDHPGRYDREWLIVLKGCEPFLRRTGRGCEIGYSALTLNGRLPGSSSPLRANTGDRVLLHVWNAGATESYNLELPGHVFEVTALDGNRVPVPARVAALQLSPGERVSAYVVVSRPSAWQVREAADSTLDLRRFGAPAPSEPATALAMVLTRHPAARSGFNRWAVNGTSFSAAEPRPAFRLRAGSRYRLRIHNTSDELVALHFQHQRLQVAGVLKDVVAIGAQQRVEVDFRAAGRGPGPVPLYAATAGRLWTQGADRLYVTLSPDGDNNTLQ